MSLRRGGPESSLRWHTKSRTGCQTCKSRKVKCDEHHPSCRNCMRRGVKCDFLGSAQITSPVPAPPNLELELLHNFTVSTASTLAAAPLVKDLWRVFVPQVGFGTRYIMDSILAISALHMARYSTPRREMLLATATYYHTASLQEALPLIPNITSENGSNLFIFGVLTLFISCASPRRHNDILVVGNGVIPEWLFLLRGMDAVIDAQAETLFSSPAAAIFRTSGVCSDFWDGDYSPSENIVLTELESRIRSTAPDGSSDHDALLKAIESLNRSYTFIEGGFSDEDKLRGIYRWFFEISDEYLKLLKDGDSKALCILAFYSVLIRCLEKYWWIEGWAVHLIARIYDLLDENYRLWIRWPIEEIGWVPEPTGRYVSQAWTAGGTAVAACREDRSDT